MATSDPTMPRPNMPELEYGSWPNATAPQVTYGAWQNVNPPQPYFDPGPIAAAPMPQLQVKPVRKGRTMVAWCLWMVAIGLAAAPLSAEYVDQAMESGIEWLAKMAPNFLLPYLPKPLEISPLQPQGLNGAGDVPAAPSAVVPTRAVAEQLEPTPEVVERPVAAKAPGLAATIKPIRPERHTEQARTHKTRATGKHALAKAESTAPVPAAKPARHSRKELSDPWAGNETGKVVASERPAKAAAEPAAVKSKPARSGDSLDDLMAGAASASPSKDHRKSGRDIDAMLQDVQKSHPAPARPTRAEPESLPALTASDIAKAMAGVKTGARACGKRFGQNGVADLKLAVGKDGRVSDVAVRGKLAGSPISGCITQAAQAASFPPNSGLKFNYRIDIP